MLRLWSTRFRPLLTLCLLALFLMLSLPNGASARVPISRGDVAPFDGLLSTLPEVQEEIAAMTWYRDSWTREKTERIRLQDVILQVNEVVDNAEPSRWGWTVGPFIGVDFGGGIRGGFAVVWGRRF